MATRSEQFVEELLREHKPLNWEDIEYNEVYHLLEATEDEKTFVKDLLAIYSYSIAKIERIQHPSAYFSYKIWLEYKECPHTTKSHKHVNVFGTLEEFIGRNCDERFRCERPLDNKHLVIVEYDDCTEDSSGSKQYPKYLVTLN